MANQPTPIPASVAAEFIELQQRAMDVIAPYAVTLTPEQRRKLPKTSDKSLSFVTKALDYGVRQPEFMPAFFTVSEFSVSMGNFNTVQPMLQAVTQVASMVSDTSMMNGSTSYSIGLEYYKTVKQFAAKNVAGAKNIAKDLSARFPHKKRKKPTPVTKVDNNDTTMKKVA